MKKILCCLLASSVLHVRAHQPRLVDSETTSISNPDVSQAFYASKAGIFIIDEPQPFTLYVQILRPKIATLDKNIKAEIRKDNKVVAILDGTCDDWTLFYEPFANDYYYQGPDITLAAQGKYVIDVWGDGKYVVVVGKKEEWPLSEIIQTIYILPRLKIYFEKSPLSAYCNLSGVFLGGMVAASAAAVYLLSLLIKRLKQR